MSIETLEDARKAIATGESVDDVARLFVASMTPEERLWCLDGDAPTWAGLTFLGSDGYHQAPFVAAEIEKRGLPGIRFSDGPRGAVVGNATCFPVPMARGATWDPDLEERVGDAIGIELRAIGANLTGAVCINVLRHPAWGRAQETYGEDPHHIGELGAALTRGLQRHVLACVKHLACNSMENSRFSVDIEIDEVALHEVYLPHFRRVVNEGVASVMSAYNSMNGEWCGQNHALLTDILRDEWTFEGFVITDWIFGLRDAATSLSAGLDIEMPYRMVRSRHLPAALDRGEVSWGDVDRSVERLIATLLRFDAILSSPDPTAEVLGSPAHRLLAREVAARSVLLLRNEPVEGKRLLPLTDSAELQLGVFGHLADTVNLGDGGSSDVWDLDCLTALDGLQAVAKNVVYDDGTDINRAEKVASSVDVAVVLVGYTYQDEGEFIGATDSSLLDMFPPEDEPEVVERFQAWLAGLPETTKPPRLSARPSAFTLGGDRSSLRLLDADVQLIRRISAVNPRTVVVIQSGSAVVVHEWIDDVPAVVMAWYGGCQAGAGIADVLFGTVNPSARLPFSVPVDEADLPVFDRDATHFRYDRWHGWWHLARNRTTPEFPFGFGLSYTTFSITDVEVEVATGFVCARGAVTNSGERDGADVVQIYAKFPDPEAPARLVGFVRVEVRAREQTLFEVSVPLDRLSSRDPVHRSWRPAKGPHHILVARHAADPDAISIEIDLS